ncbi:MAG: hypothetical protein E7623_07495 [Ruminococcaceae bacterium]|nr:hypothetical protein [Oscillospiraceae bacterium]
MIIDFHTHCFPDSLAPKAMASLMKSSDGKNHSDGTAGGLIEKMDIWGIDRSVVCNIATNAKQMTKVNSFAIEINGKQGKISSLGSLNPDAEDGEIEEEFKRLSKAGIRGIKIHPDFQNRFIEDECYERIFEGSVKYKMFVVTHAGLDRVSPDLIHATPDGILKVIDKHPDLTLIAAHMGGKEIWDEVEEKLVGKPLYFDTAVTALCEIGKERAERIINTHGAERILFGSDNPWADGRSEYEFIKSLSISEEEKEMILYRNALRLLGLEG